MKRVGMVFLLAVLSAQILYSQPVLSQPPVTGLAVAGEWVVSCSKAGLQVHSCETLQQLRTIDLPIQSAHDLAFSPDGTLLAVAGGNAAVDGTICLLSWPSGELVSRLGDHTDVAMAVCWLSDSELASGSLDSTVQVWDITTQEKLHTLTGHSRGILSLCKVDEGRLLVSAGIDQSLRVWTLPSGERLRSLTIHTRPIQSIATRPTRPGLPMIASAGDDRTVRFWQPTIGRMVRFARLNSKPISLTWQLDGSKVITLCEDGSLHAIDPDTVVVQKLSQPTGSVAYDLAVSLTDKSVFVSDGSELKRVTVDDDSEVR